MKPIHALRVPHAMPSLVALVPFSSQCIAKLFIRPLVLLFLAYPPQAEKNCTQPKKARSRIRTYHHEMQMHVNECEDYLSSDYTPGVLKEGELGQLPILPGSPPSRIQVENDGVGPLRMKS